MVPKLTERNVPPREIYPSFIVISPSIILPVASQVKMLRNGHSTYLENNETSPHLQHVKPEALPIFILIAKCDSRIEQSLVILQPRLGRDGRMHQLGCRRCNLEIVPR